MKSTPEELERRVELVETLLDRTDKRFDRAEARVKGAFGTLIVLLGLGYLFRHWLLG